MPFKTPKEVTAAELVFGGEINELLPPMKDIPEEFKRGRTKWNKFFSDLMFRGIHFSGIVPKEGIDLKMAIRHIRAVTGSFVSKHEHKEAGVAYLASLWFEESLTWETLK